MKFVLEIKRKKKKLTYVLLLTDRDWIWELRVREGCAKRSSVNEAAGEPFHFSMSLRGMPAPDTLHEPSHFCIICRCFGMKKKEVEHPSRALDTLKQPR